MKKLMVAIAGAVALTCSAFADATSWFNGGVEQGWPNSAVGGAWSNTTEQTEYTAGTLTVEADAETPVAFNATDAKTIGGDAKTVTVSSTVKFTPFEELPEVPENAKAAVVAIKDGNFWILESDMDADPVTNKWTETDIPTTANAVAVTVCISEGLADYKIGDSAVIQANMVFEGSISAANYTGDGEITSLTATYEANVVTLKLPADPANVGSVIVSNVTDGVAVEKKDGVYTFPYGANAQVWIYAKEGYLFANGENFKKYDETMTANKDYSSETPENPTEAEAKIGTKYYLTLNAAFDAAKSKDTVYLLKDYTETIELPAKTITFDYQDRKITTTGKCFILQSGSHIALSGNGAAVTSTGSVAIRFADGTDGASFTVDRGSYVGYNGAVAFGKSKNCTITINGGQFEAKDNSVIAGNGTADCGNNTLTIKDARLVGEIETEGYIACGIYWPCSGTVTVESTIIGFIKGGCGVCSRAGTVKLADDVTIEYGKVGPGEVEGWIGDNKNIVPGVSVYFDYAAAYPGYAAGDTIKAMDTEELTVAKGQIWFAADGEGYRSLGRKEDAQAKIGTTFYLTFAEALSKMTGGEVVELCKDIDLGKTSIAATANGMIDLAGYTITGKVGASDKYLFSISKGAQVTFTNGTFEAEAAAKFTTFFHNYGNLVLADLSLDAKYLTGSNEYSDGANVIACMNGTISVAGSTEIVNNEGFALSVGNHAADYPSRAVTLDTTGNLSGDFRFCGGSVTCLAATFDDDAKFYYGCACNTSTPKNNSCYADADIAGFAGLVARVGEDPALVQTQYYTILGELYLGLDAAIADAEAGDKITLVNPVTVATLTVGKNCTIDLNGQLFTANGAVALDADVKLVNSKQAGLFAPNGVVTIAADKVLDLSEMPFGSTQYGIEGTGSITITSGAEAKFYAWGVPSVDSANWMYANMPAFFTGGVIPVGGKVTIGSTTWTGTADGFEVPGTVAFAQIDATGQIGLVTRPIVVNECYTTLDAAIEKVKVGGTVTLADDITTDVEAAFAIDKDLTLDFGDYTVSKTVANHYTFDIANGATVVFDGGEGGVVQAASSATATSPAAAIRNKGNLTIKGGVYTSDVCVIKNDEDPGAGVLTVDGGTFNIVAAAPEMKQIPMALMNWATATINGGTWNGTIGTRSCDGNNVSKFGVTTIAAELEGDVDYLLYVGHPGDTTYANVPKITGEGINTATVTLGQVDDITDQLTLVTDADDYVTVAQTPTVKVADIAAPEGLDAAFAYTTNCAPNALFKDWDVNYVVTFDADVKAGSLKLAGKYTSTWGSFDWTDFPLTEDLDEDEEWTLLPEGQIKYQDLYAMQEFDCGVANFTAPEGTKMTVVLKMYNSATDEEFVLNTKEYTLAAAKEAKIGTTYYLTLKAAFDAAKDGDTVTLLVDDATLASNFVITNTLTFDLNGHTLTTLGSYALRLQGGTTTIDDTSANQDGAIVQTKDATVIEVGTTGKPANLILKAGAIRQNVLDEQNRAGALVKVENGVFTMNGGTLDTNMRAKETAIRSKVADGAVINGGTIIGAPEVQKSGTFVIPTDSTVKIHNTFAAAWSQYLPAGYAFVPTVPASDYCVIGTGYAVAFAETTGGAVETSVTNNIAAGTVVTITATSNEGYSLDQIAVSNGMQAVTVTDNAFTMPEANVTVYATFKSKSIEPGQTQDLPVSPEASQQEAQEAADKVKVKITDQEAAAAGQADVVKPVAVYDTVNSKWVVEVQIDTNAVAYVEPEVASETIATNLAAVAASPTAVQVAIPADDVTPGLYYTVIGSAELDFEDSVNGGSALATDEGVTLTVPKVTNSTKAFFKVQESMSPVPAND